MLIGMSVNQKIHPLRGWRHMGQPSSVNFVFIMSVKRFELVVLASLSHCQSSSSFTATNFIKPKPAIANERVCYHSKVEILRIRMKQVECQ